MLRPQVTAHTRLGNRPIRPLCNRTTLPRRPLHCWIQSTASRRPRRPRLNCQSGHLQRTQGSRLLDASRQAMQGMLQGKTFEIESWTPLGDRDGRRGRHLRTALNRQSNGDRLESTSRCLRRHQQRQSGTTLHHHWAQKQLKRKRRADGSK